MNTNSKTLPLRSKGNRSANNRSDARRGRVYDDTFSYDDIRAVTPDPSASSGSELTALPSPTSYTAQDQPGLPIRDSSASISNTDEESATDGTRQKIKRRFKGAETRTPSDTSPTNRSIFQRKPRDRLNSISALTASSSSLDGNVTSIGFPSVMQSPQLPDDQVKENRKSGPKLIGRAASAENTPTVSSMPPRSPSFLESESGKILQLMKTTCGRMHGILFYRTIGSHSWDSGYCAINVAPGSLVCQMQGDVSQSKVLIPDLRGCTVRTQYDFDSQSRYLSVVMPVSGFGCQLRPPILETFDSWLAALLCWQPLRPKGINSRIVKSQTVSAMDKKAMTQKRLSDVAPPKSTATVKVGQMYLWRGPLPPGSLRQQTKRMRLDDAAESRWLRVNCVLLENGTFRLLEEGSISPLCSVKLASLSRCAIQRLDDTIFDKKYCITIQPSHSVTIVKTLPSDPLYLCLEHRTAFEAWLTMLKAMTAPELYGPESPIQENVSTSSGTTQALERSSQIFRVERSLSVKVLECKLSKTFSDSMDSHVTDTTPRTSARTKVLVYADVMLGRELRARTTTKMCSTSVFWAEEFHLVDVPNLLTQVSVMVKQSNPHEREWTMASKSFHGNASGVCEASMDVMEIASHDPICGMVNIPVSEFEQKSFVERWWALLDNNDIQVGQMLIRCTLSETVVLMSCEYQELSTLLHTFGNGLTSQIAQVLGQELKKLSDVLLDLFQASDDVEDWLNNLVEEEIDGTYKETPPLRMRFSGRMHSNDLYESAEQREVLMRDMSRSATMEVNLLFRGNSLVTKALDAHMRRIGQEYLEGAIGAVVRRIALEDADCEVDPNRVSSTEQLTRNWAKLIGLTKEIWMNISSSAARCPPGMRKIFQHIKSCVEDKYGDFVRTVQYTSVSGFLFLRFFCPAILNPRLFGLIDDQPPERARRTFTLVAKSLNALANMTKFGQKERWMEPMNKFVTSASAEFRKFVEEACSYDPVQDARHEPQYRAPIQVRNRLPPTSREGLHTLPYLLDPARSMAMLVQMWVAEVPSDDLDVTADEEMRTFHKLCLRIYRATQECLRKAEKAQEPDSRLEPEWQQLVDEQRDMSRPTLHSTEGRSGRPSYGPHRGSPRAPRPATSGDRSTDGGGLSQHMPPEPRLKHSAHTASSIAPESNTSNNSSTISLEMHSDPRTPKSARGKDGAKSRLFEITGRASRKLRLGNEEAVTGERHR